MDKVEIREVIAKRASLELNDQDVVNLGIGLPTMIPNYLGSGVEVYFQAENGILGVGHSPAAEEKDLHIADAGDKLVTILPGGSVFDSALSFSIIRGGHIDATILGALQVDEKGNLASWMIPGKLVPGMGGAMDLAMGAKRVIIAMEHTAKGRHKILKRCDLPLTAAGEVDMIITEKCVLEVTEKGLLLKEIHPLSSVEDVKENTGADLIVSEDLKPMFEPQQN